MTRLKMTGAIVLILAVMTAAGAWLMRGQIALDLMTRAYDRAMGSDPIAALPDGLSVGLWLGLTHARSNPRRALRGDCGGPPIVRG